MFLIGFCFQYYFYLPLSKNFEAKQCNQKIRIERFPFKQISQNYLWFCGHTGIPGLWTQELDAGLWTLDLGRWTLYAGLCTLEPGRWTLDAGLWTLDLDTGRWTLDSGCWTLDPGCCTLDSGPWTLDYEPWGLDAGLLKLNARL